MRAESKRSVHDAIAKLEKEISEKSSHADTLRRQASAIDDEVSRLRRSYDAMRESFGLPRMVVSKRRPRKDSLSNEERVSREKMVMEPMLTLRGATMGEVARAVKETLGYTTVAKLIRGLVMRGVVVRHGNLRTGSVYSVAETPKPAPKKDASKHYSLREEEIMKCALSVMATGIAYGPAELLRNLQRRILNLTEQELRTVLSKMAADHRVKQDEFQYRVVPLQRQQGGLL